MVKLNSADADFLREARKRFEAGIEADRENRRRDEQDRKFFKGEQWSADEKIERKGRITVTINRQPQFVKQVTGEMRQNKPAIRVLPKDDLTDPKLAEVYSAIIRHIESISDAHRIYNKAAEQAVIGGIGWYRILTDYLDDTSFDQEIVIKPVRNPLSVVFDPDAQELCKQDMNWGFVTELVSLEKFKSANPKANLTGFDNPHEEEYAQWKQGEFIRVAEYWYKEKVKRTLAMLSDGSTRFLEKGDERLLDQANAELVAAGQQPILITNSREVDTHKVCWSRMTGFEVIDKGEWAGKWIPLVPVIGEEIETGDEVYRHGLIHHSRDAQKSYNYARSAMMEHVGAQPKAPYLVTAKMVVNYKNQWENLNKSNPPVLVYDPDPQQPAGPKRESPPTLASAWYQEAQVADQDMKATTGIYDASLGQRGNETSGRAIIAREQQGDTATYVYVDNREAAILHTGNVLVDLIPHIYSDERIIRIMGEDGEIEEYARLNTRLPDGRTWNDITQGRYDVQVTSGPAYATRRMEAADKLMQLSQANPAIAQVAGDEIVKALDIPNGQKIAERLQIMFLPPGLDPEVDKKRMEMQLRAAQMQQALGGGQPDAMQQLQMRDAAAKVAGTEADSTIKQVNAAQAVAGFQMMNGFPQGMPTGG